LFGAQHRPVAVLGSLDASANLELESSPRAKKGNRMTHFIPFSGFLGAGKTTTILTAAAELEAQGRTVAIITNDQGRSLVDTKLVRSKLGAVAEVSGGCLCCRFDDLLAVTDQLLAGGEVDTVLAEAVGSCTDLQATVLRPLRQGYGDRFEVAPLTTIVDPQRLRGFWLAAERGYPESNMSYLFGLQLAEAEIIALNKADALTPDGRADLREQLSQRYPEATVVTYSARTHEGFTDLVNAWGEPPRSPVIEVDYDRYAAAEAELAWFNNTYAVESASGFSPVRWARAALESLAGKARQAQWVIGHAKVAIETKDGLTKMSVVDTSGPPTIDSSVGDAESESGVVNLNARIRCEPAEMDAAAAAALATADAACGTMSRPVRAVANSPISFKPAYPTPIHRILGTV
jgi:Ni2+-binding GTPase involved in maturation of urease and hydrogenase